MSTVYIHEKDNASDEEQIKTLNLSLKSIEGNEKQMFERIADVTRDNTTKIQEIAKLNVVLGNYVKNLTKSAKQLISLEINYYNIKKQSNKLVKLATEYGYKL